MCSDARSSRRWRPAHCVALAVTLLLPACSPMDSALQAVFGRSMRDQPSFDPYENTRMPADGAVSFSSGNYPAGLTQDVPEVTALDMAQGGGAGQRPGQSRASYRAVVGARRGDV